MKKILIGLALVLVCGTDALAQWPRREPERVYRCMTFQTDIPKAFNIVDAETGVIYLALTQGQAAEPVTQCWWLKR